jgi:hypothetical protein
MNAHLFYFVKLTCIDDVIKQEVIYWWKLKKRLLHALFAKKKITVVWNKRVAVGVKALRCHRLC